MSRREILSSDGLRVDGRRSHEWRTLSMEVGVMPSQGIAAMSAASNIDGSALVQLGNTKILCTVSGPRPSFSSSSSTTPPSPLSVNFFYAPFASMERRFRGKSDRLSSDSAFFLRETLSSCILSNSYVDSSITVGVTVLQDDGGILSAAVIGASLALMSAGIAMRDCLMGITVGLADGIPLVDLNFHERGAERPQLFLVLRGSQCEVVSAQCEGRCQNSAMESMIEMGRKAGKEVLKAMKEEMKKYAEKVLQSRGFVQA